MNLNSCCGLAAALALVFLSTPSSLPAQSGKKKAEPTTGTVVSIEKAKTGRSFTLTMKTADDTEYEVPIAPRTPVVITAGTDGDFLKPGMIIQEQVDDASDDQFVAEKLTICVGLPLLPQFSPVNPNTDDGKFQMIGKILTGKKDVNGEGGHILSVMCGVRTVTIAYPADIPFTVKLTDPAFIKEGDTVEVEGPIIKAAKKITAKSITVTAVEPIPSADYFAAVEDSKKSKSQKTTASKTKSKGDAKPEMEGDAEVKESDPFGVQKGKKSPPSKTDKSNVDKSKTDDKKTDDKKTDDKKTDEAEKS